MLDRRFLTAGIAPQLDRFDGEGFGFLPNQEFTVGASHTSRLGFKVAKFQGLKAKMRNPGPTLKP
jgi:hypothetical protein